MKLKLEAEVVSAAYLSPCPPPAAAAACLSCNERDGEYSETRAGRGAVWTPVTGYEVDLEMNVREFLTILENAPI